MSTKPGRPSRESSQDASDSIINAACLYFSQQGIKGTTYKQIGAAAGVTAAMVHYYFKQKEDLHLAVIEFAFKPLITDLKQATDLGSWVQIFHSHIMHKLWLPHLMLREVLPHNGELRLLFLEHCAPHVFGSIKAMVKNEFKHLSPSRKPDPDRHVVLLMGMLVYPFLGMNIAQDVTGKKFDKRMLENFRDDALALFRAGIAAQ